MTVTIDLLRLYHQLTQFILTYHKVLLGGLEGISPPLIIRLVLIFILHILG
jgi:hypothetical protein